ncbi:ankyrin repeat domain-containing protein [Baekduia soli]|uniref:Ankyrin repeat domain-containing protein n=1 Tax=Baekduia soli TaxID=496014 RepID=A0A5B8U6J2_9ACTN|nr:ankyrin repeat domain-containing protein [Baekduia soli]QEC48620.1 ankyrin repeat domain-containing protein [Baekduia soli]
MGTPAPEPLGLDALHRRAKELARAHAAGDPAAVARAGAHRANPLKPLKVAGAQHVLARELGFDSWPRLRAYVQRVETHGTALEHAYHEDLGSYEGRAEGLLASARDGTPGALAPFEGTGAPLTSAGARTVVAQRHGFATWSALRRHVEDLREGGEPFARAYRAVEARADGALRELLDLFPDLVTARGTNGNDLLGMATATGDERVVDLLLERGSDPNHANAHGWTPLHQTAYSDQPRLARRLLDAGAWPEVSARGEGGTPLVAALFWGHRRVTEVLEPEGVLPRNLRAAAGLGRLDVLDELVAADGTVSPAAGAHRGFYRPHSGFPPWAPSDDPQEVLDEALSWAARSDRVEALDVLVARGARVDADVYRGTALAWAAASGRVAAVGRLLALGADVDARGTFGGPDHGDGVTALHLAAQGGRREVVEALLAAGADPALRDAGHDGTAAGWAQVGGHDALAALLCEREG